MTWRGRSVNEKVDASAADDFPQALTDLLFEAEILAGHSELEIEMSMI
jgi:hypothetical protein